MSHKDVLNSLQKRNDSLKSRLLHEQLKYGNYSFRYFDKYSQLVIEEYAKTSSLSKSAINVGIDPLDAVNWYVQGQLGNGPFRGFYLKIKNTSCPAVSREETPKKEDVPLTSVESEIPDGDYIISQYGDGWSYKTFKDGEKIFLISSDLDKLKDKVKSRHLPLD